jgi:hypothetical protein
MPAKELQIEHNKIVRIGKKENGTVNISLKILTLNHSRRLQNNYSFILTHFLPKCWNFQ